VGDARPGGGADKAGHAGIAKQVEDARLILARFDGGLLPRPVGGLFREEGQVTEGSEASVEFDAVIAQGPLLVRAAAERPAAAILILVFGVENRVGLVPQVGIFRRPPALRLWPNDQIVAIAFEFQPLAGVNQGIVAPRQGAQGQGRRADVGHALAIPPAAVRVKSSC
jgi:hypothetical protein